MCKCRTDGKVSREMYNCWKTTKFYGKCVSVGKRTKCYGECISVGRKTKWYGECVSAGQTTKVLRWICKCWIGNTVLRGMWKCWTDNKVLRGMCKYRGDNEVSRGFGNWRFQICLDFFWERPNFTYYFFSALRVVPFMANTDLLIWNFLLSTLFWLVEAYNQEASVKFAVKFTVGWTFSLWFDYEHVCYFVNATPLRGKTFSVSGCEVLHWNLLGRRALTGILAALQSERPCWISLSLVRFCHLHPCWEGFVKCGLLLWLVEDVEVGQDSSEEGAADRSIADRKYAGRTVKLREALKRKMWVLKWFVCREKLRLSACLPACLSLWKRKFCVSKWSVVSNQSLHNRQDKIKQATCFGWLSRRQVFIESIKNY
jgi:hypothetical protein